MILLEYIFYGACVVQLLYFLLVFAPFVQSALRKSLKADHTKVSVVVCAHNELLNLQKLIPALLEQDYPDFEVVLADDRSSDGTGAWLREFKDPRLRVVTIADLPDKVQPKKNALTQAIKASHGEIMLVTDADCMPSGKQWIKKMLESLHGDTEIALGYAPYARRKGFLNALIRFETFYTALQYFGFAHLGHPYMGVGRNMAYKKSLFEQNNGLSDHAHIMGGDDDLFIRQVAHGKNTLAVTDPDTFMVSEAKTTYASWFRQKRRHLSVGVHYKLKHLLLLGLLTLSHIGFYLTFALLVIFQPKISLILWFLVRILVIMYVYWMGMRKLKEMFAYCLLPILDVFYIFNYCLVTISILLDRKIRWI